MSRKKIKCDESDKLNKKTGRRSDKPGKKTGRRSDKPGKKTGRGKSDRLSKRNARRDESELYRMKRRILGMSDDSTSSLVEPTGDRHHDELLRQRGLLAEDHTENLPTEIPDDASKFYKLAGPFENTSEGKRGQPVKHLTPYQIAAWNDRKHAKYRLYLKSQKIGMTTYFLLEDLHIGLTYGCGMEILIVGQTKEKAQQHLQVLRHYIRNSPTYSGYLIENSAGQNNNEGDEGLLPDERTKTDVIYLRNPMDSSRPTKIMALGITSVGSLISFMRVVHIHMSDVTMAQQTDEHAQMAFGGLFSRLANTNGTMVIECPPRGPSGPVWDIVDSAPELKKNGYMVELTDDPVDIPKLGFRVRRLTYKVGIKAGIITQEFIDKEREKQGTRFAMYYETDFYSSDTTWFPKEYGTRDWSATIPSYEKLNTELMAEVHKRIVGVITGKEPNLDGEIGGYADESDIAKFVDCKATDMPKQLKKGYKDQQRKPVETFGFNDEGKCVKFVAPADGSDGEPRQEEITYTDQMRHSGLSGMKSGPKKSEEEKRRLLKKQNEETAKEMRRIQEETDRELEELRKTRDQRKRRYGIE